MNVRWKLPACALQFAMVVGLMAAGLVWPCAAREWSDASGKFKIPGELEKVEGGIVFIKSESGKVVKVPYEKLSAEDRAFLRAERAKLVGTGDKAPENDDKVADFTPGVKPVTVVPSPIQVKDEAQDGVIRTMDMTGNLVDCAKFAPDGKTLFVGGSTGILVLDVATGKVLSKFPLPNYYGPKERSNWSSDGKKFAMRGHDGHAYVFDVLPSGAFDNFQSLDLFDSSRIETVNICLDGKFLLALEDSQLKLVNLEADGHPKIKIPCKEKIYLAHDVWISPDGARAIITSTSDAFHVDLKMKQVKHVKLPILFAKGGFSPDGKVVTSGTTDEIRFVSTVNGKILGQLPVKGIGARMCFSPTGKHLVVATQTAVSVYDVATGKQLAQTDMPKMSPLSVSVSPDNRLVALTSHGETVDPNNLYRPVLILRFPCLGE